MFWSPKRKREKKKKNPGIIPSKKKNPSKNKDAFRQTKAEQGWCQQTCALQNVLKGRSLGRRKLDKSTNAEGMTNTRKGKV